MISMVVERKIIFNKFLIYGDRRRRTEMDFPIQILN